MEITPTKSVNDGYNGTVAGVSALAASLERNRQMDLYNEYGNLVFEDFESFVHRMEASHGEQWVDKLTTDR